MTACILNFITVPGAQFSFVITVRVRNVASGLKMLGIVKADIFLLSGTKSEYVGKIY